MYIFKQLAALLAIEPSSDQFIRRSLFQYYSTFPSDHINDLWLEEIETSASVKKQIKSKYFDFKKGM